jgi:RNA polymerase sigma-70 factor, ECF subfamily
MREHLNYLPKEAHEALIRVVQVYLQRRSQALEPGALITLYWEEFYRLYSPLVQRTLKHCFPKPMERDDVAQEIWLTIARKLPGFQWLEGSEGFEAWMGKLIRHKAIDVIRRKRRYSKSVLGEPGAVGSEPTDTEADPAQFAERRCRNDAVRAVLAKLRPRVAATNFQLLQLHYWEGLTVRAIAAQVGLTHDQVWCRLHRLLGKVRRALPVYLGEEFGKRRDRRS